jgi:predicted acyl esterase
MPEVREQDRDEQLNRALAAAGFAVVAVDARGTGASFGVSRAPWSAEEIEDDRDVLDWVVAQPWSDGSAVAFGISYDANAAMRLSALGHPALKAVAPLFPDFDPYAGIAFPGGVFNRGFVTSWNALNQALDRNDACQLAQLRGLPCEMWKAAVAGPRPVEDPLLPLAIAEHGANLDLLAALGVATCSDDPLGPGLPSLEDVAPHRAAAGINQANTPWMVRVGWHDADTVAGALAAYRTLSNPMVLIVGATNHAGLFRADPFLPPGAPAEPPFEEQLGETIQFLGEALGGKPVERAIRYQTLGEGTWRSARSWPPEGVSERTLYLGTEGTLVESPPGEQLTEQLQVDPQTSTGTKNRWLTPLDAGAVAYEDRAEQDKKMAVYTTPPLEKDLRVTGDPSIVLHLTPSGDGAVFVYLEDVAPDGKVTYITEGLLALEHRNSGTAPYQGAPFARSFHRAGRAQVQPGEPLELRIPLSPVSALFRAGHRIRVAIAGADADTFGPASAGLSYAIHRGTPAPSRLMLPVAPPEGTGG